MAGHTIKFFYLFRQMNTLGKIDEKYIEKLKLHHFNEDEHTEIIKLTERFENKFSKAEDRLISTPKYSTRDQNYN